MQEDRDTAKVVDPGVIMGGESGEEAVCRFQLLSYEQVTRLHEVMEEVVPIHGRGNFPTLHIRLKDLVRVIRRKLEHDGIHVRDIRLNGGAASHILASDNEQLTYNDLDLIFGVQISNSKDIDCVKNAVLSSLLDFLPEGVNKEKMTSCSLKEGYVHKMVKIMPNNFASTDNHSKYTNKNFGTNKNVQGLNRKKPQGDLWSLISLKNNLGKHVDLKFVDTMKRQFEFSVDSFQVILDSLLLFYDCTEMPMSASFYPTVVGESVYGDFGEALRHLDQKLIDTRNPEEIRGGGLLKYVHLLVREYDPVSNHDMKSLERYMCSRFFIDFKDVFEQQHKLESYLSNHFDSGDHQIKYDYLMTLYRVVDESTVCLMGHERRQTLMLIDQLAYRQYLQEQQQQNHRQQSWAGYSSPSSSSSSLCPSPAPSSASSMSTTSSSSGSSWYPDNGIGQVLPFPTSCTAQPAIYQPGSYQQ